MHQNYQALGEYAAHKRQAIEAAKTRFAYLTVLGRNLIESADKPEQAILEADIQKTLDSIFRYDREMRAALNRANTAAPLCGEPDACLRKLFNMGD